MKNWSLKKLISVAAEICDYALDHYDTRDGTCKAKTPWPEDSPNHSLAWEALGASSYTLSCIAAQHTPGGRNGVETEAPFYALRMWEFMSLKKRRRLAKTFFKELGAQKQYAKKPHQPLVAACTPAPPHAPPAESPRASKPYGTTYVATDPKGLLGGIKTIESACPKCLGPMEFEIGVSIRMDTSPEVVSIDTDGSRGSDYWWCEACGTHADPLQLDALAEARADARAAKTEREARAAVTPAAEDEREALPFRDMDPEDLQRELQGIAKTYGAWLVEAADYRPDRRDALHRSMELAMKHRMDLAFCDRRHTPHVGDRVITLNGDNDCDDHDDPRVANPGTEGKVVAVNESSFDVVFDSGCWVCLEFYEICDPTQYTWEP